MLAVVLCLIFKQIAHQTLNCAHKMAQSEHMEVFPATSWPTAIYHREREREREHRIKKSKTTPKQLSPYRHQLREQEVSDGFDDKTYLKQTELQLWMNSTVYLAASASATCTSVPAGYARQRRAEMA